MSTGVVEEGGQSISQNTVTVSCTAIYLRLRLSFEENLQIELNQRTFRQCLLQSLIQVFGKIGGAIPFEVLSVQQDGTVVFLKADKRDLTRLRAACTLTSSFEGQSCHFQVEAVSPFLASLAQDSRSFAAQLPFPSQ